MVNKKIDYRLKPRLRFGFFFFFLSRLAYIASSVS